MQSRADKTDRVGVETLNNVVGTVLLFERGFQCFLHRSGYSDHLPTSPSQCHILF